MKKDLVGQHLLRVRIRKRIFEQLKDVAKEEAHRTGNHITVSDLVRAACYNYLLIHEAVQRLESSPPPEIEDEVLVVTTPML